MSQYGWRIGSVAAGSLALYVAARGGWSTAYLLCAAFALPAMLTGLVLGEPARHRPPPPRAGLAQAWQAVAGPLLEFFRRRGAFLVLLFVLLHKIGDTLANLTLRLLLNDLGFSNDEIATYDVGFGFVAMLAGIFLGGVLYASIGMKRSVLIALVLMAVSNSVSPGWRLWAIPTPCWRSRSASRTSPAASAAWSWWPTCRRCATWPSPPPSSPCSAPPPAWSAAC